MSPDVGVVETRIVIVAPLMVLAKPQLRWEAALISSAVLFRSRFRNNPSFELICLPRNASAQLLLLSQADRLTEWDRMGGVEMSARPLSSRIRRGVVAATVAFAVAAGAVTVPAFKGDEEREASKASTSEKAVAGFWPGAGGLLRIFMRGQHKSPRCVGSWCDNVVYA